ncbi:hypothetical protein AVEN_116667-1 [Araneus ventricosus]|uniref:Uncharacterized protein n=1 Tax=Araneus ventricosus TaxID=182803 RepID=A0A4Y2WNJ2_ARAVE|nr:hypothetical protein AVEN_116667-1 [Araneus ventricosus]
MEIVTFCTEIPGRYQWLSDQLSTKKETTFFLKKLPRRPKPPESSFCPKGGLRRDRAHTVNVRNFSINGEFSKESSLFTKLDVNHDLNTARVS